MLIILGGLPGVGKTTVAINLARRHSAVHVRIDSIEHAVRGFLGEAQPLDDLGYRVGYAVAEDNLRVGRTVIADSVNPIRLTREAWIDVARRAGVRAMEVELICSDKREHRVRVEARPANLAGFRPPSWEDVVRREYEPWRGEHLVIDTAEHTVAQSVEAICTYAARAAS
jgi:predicted kinase